MKSKILSVLGQKAHIHKTKGGQYKIKLEEPLPDYLKTFAQLRELDIRFELTQPIVEDEETTINDWIQK